LRPLFVTLRHTVCITNLARACVRACVRACARMGAGTRARVRACACVRVCACVCACVRAVPPSEHRLHQAHRMISSAYGSGGLQIARSVVMMASADEGRAARPGRRQNLENLSAPRVAHHGSIARPATGESALWAVSNRIVSILQQSIRQAALHAVGFQQAIRKDCTT